jgi:demethylmenaquinone methyltransferase / 2-methoxy-6-polyprenyl-1,4-benzoquinol methylase
MANKFYDPGEQRAAKVSDLFATVARRYDLLNDLQSLGLQRRWKRRLVELANPRPGEGALDVCCGTGDIAFLLAAHGAEVTGLDFSEPMLAIARARTQNSKLKTQNFLQGDALALPFPDASFDIVTIGYGLRNLASWETGLREMTRVLKPGGRLLVLDFGKPANAIWRSLYFAHLKLVVPLLGRIFCRDASAYAYILESLKQYPAQAGVAAKMRELGLVEIQIVNLLGGAMSIHYAKRPI